VGYYIGLISGTSMDGVDAALVDFSAAKPRVVATHQRSYSRELHHKIQHLLQQPHTLTEYGSCDAALGDYFATTANTLINNSGIDKTQIHAIGSHGQTLWHAPNDTHPFSLQIGCPASIAARTGITTIADFRRADIAHGGQGAPLVPAFHQAVFSSPTETRAVLNLGGIANITCLSPDRETLGYDTGPANTLLDDNARKHFNQPYDNSGTIAAAGNVDQQALQALLADPYFAQPAPKSTGPEYFNAEWLAEKLHGHDLTPHDRQATLTALTAQSVAQAIQHHAINRVLVCGGGAHNATLMNMLSEQLPGVTIETTTAHGIAPDWVEAAAFAWLAKQTLDQQPGNLPSATGANRSAILGAIYPA